MIDRNYQYAEYAGPYTGVALYMIGPTTFSGTAGDRYLFIVTVAANAGTFDIVFEGNSGGYDYDHYITQRDANDMYSCPMIFPQTVSGGGLLTVALSGIPDSGNITVRQAGVYAFKLLPCDQTNDNYLTAGSTTNATSYTTVTGSTITIAETGEYLVLASASVRKDETTANFNIRMTVNGTTPYGDQLMRATSATKYFPWAHVVKLSLTAGDVLALEHKVSTTGNVNTIYPSIVALRTAMLPGLIYAEDTADDSTTSTTYAAKPGLNDCFPSKAYASLILSCGRYRRGAGSVDASVQSTYDGTTFFESRNESVVATGEAVHFGTKGVTPTAGQHTIQQQYRSEGTGISAAFLNDSAVVLINLENNVTTQIYSGAVYGGEVY